MAGERHGHGMGTAWARHAMCESALRSRCMGVFRTGYVMAVLSTRTETNLLGRTGGWVNVNFMGLRRDGLFAPNFKIIRLFGKCGYLRQIFKARG
jgi:hypothetical protein